MQQGRNSETITDELTYVRDKLAVTKQAAFLCLQAASLGYGDQINEEQEVLGLLADTLIEVYAIESTLLRTDKLIQSRGVEQCQVQIAMAQTYACDGVERVATNTRLLQAILADEGAANELTEAMSLLDWLPPSNTKASRRLIAAALLEGGRYLW